MYFNEDCAEAMLHCPQVTTGRAYAIEDREILLGEINKKEVFKHWMNEGVLWELGYDEYLTEEALEWVEKWKEYKVRKKFWKLENKG